MNKNRLKLFDNSWVCQGSLTIPGGGIWDVSVVDVNTVIVTAPHTEKLHYVQILPQLQRGRAIQLPQVQFGRDILLDSRWTHDATESVFLGMTST